MVVVPHSVGMKDTHEGLVELLGLEQTVSPDVLVAIVSNLISKNRDLREQAAKMEIDLNKMQAELEFEVNKSKYYYKQFQDLMARCKSKDG